MSLMKLQEFIANDYSKDDLLRFATVLDDKIDDLERELRATEDNCEEFQHRADNPEWVELFDEKPMLKRALEEAYQASTEQEVISLLARFYEELGLDKPLKLNNVV